MAGSSAKVIWHDTECGAYAADLDAWERLASVGDGPVLDLGSGTGRVALHLARREHEVWAIDTEADFVAALRERSEGLPVHVERADVRELDLGRRFRLVIAAMQFIQMVGPEPARAEVLRSVAAHLEPGGRLAAAILDGLPSDITDASTPLPDIREFDGRVYSSLPADVIEDGARLELRRLRQEVAVDGTMSESQHSESLWLCDADALEREGAAAWLAPRERISVPAMNGYIGSVIVVMERP
jgi:SAM-dependent methyltransferase